jgi:hypothetical protein
MKTKLSYLETSFVALLLLFTLIVVRRRYSPRRLVYRISPESPKGFGRLYFLKEIIHLNEF